MDNKIVISDPRQALEYFENYLKTFDYYKYVKSLDIINEELSSLISRCMSKYYTNYESFELEFKILSSMLSVRIDAFSLLNEELLEYYRKDNNIKLKETFNIYKKVLDILIENTDEYLNRLNMDINMYLKYGGDNDISNNLNKTYEMLKELLLSLTTVSKLEEIRVIKIEEEKRLKALIKKYKSIGIKPHEAYKNAINLYNERNFDEAIKIFIQIEEYRNSKDYINKINNITHFENNLLIMNDLIYQKSIYDNFYNLSNFNNTIIHNISNIITKFGSSIYYINVSNMLIKHNLNANKETLILDNPINIKEYTIYKSSLYFITEKDDLLSLFLLDMLDDKLYPIIENNKTLYFIKNSYIFENDSNLKIQNLDMTSPITLPIDSIVTDISNDYIVYTKPGLINTTYVYLVQSNKHQELDINISKIDKIYKDVIIYEICFGESNILVSYSPTKNTKTTISNSLDSFLDVKDDYIYFIEKKSLCNVLCRADIYSNTVNQTASDVSNIIDISFNRIIYQDSDYDIRILNTDSNETIEVSHFSDNVSYSNNLLLFEKGNTLYSYNLLDGTYRLLIESKDEYKVVNNIIYSLSNDKLYIVNIDDYHTEIIEIIKPSEKIIEETVIESKDKISINEIIATKKNGGDLSIDQINALKEYTKKYYRNMIIVIVILFIILASFYLLFFFK